MVSKNVMNLCTLNVNGMHNKEKMVRVTEFLKRNKCSIAFLQETHLDDNLKKEIDFFPFLIHFVVTGQQPVEVLPF